MRLEIGQKERGKREEDIAYENAEGQNVDIEPNKIEEDITRQVYHPLEKAFDYGNKRVTDLP